MQGQRLRERKARRPGDRRRREDAQTTDGRAEGCALPPGCPFCPGSARLLLRPSGAPFSLGGDAAERRSGAGSPAQPQARERRWQVRRGGGRGRRWGRALGVSRGRGVPDPSPPRSPRATQPASAPASRGGVRGAPKAPAEAGAESRARCPWGAPGRGAATGRRPRAGGW